MGQSYYDRNTKYYDRSGNAKFLKESEITATNSSGTLRSTLFNPLHYIRYLRKNNNGIF